MYTYNDYEPTDEEYEAVRRYIIESTANMPNVTVLPFMRGWSADELTDGDRWLVDEVTDGA